MAEPSSSAESNSSGQPASGAASGEPLGFGAQFGRTRDAVLGLVQSHFRLLSTELSEIMDEVKKALALGAAAIGLILMASLLVFVGTILWLDEWVFGSIGWGVVHGGFGLIGIAVVLGLAIIPRSGPRIGLGLFVALLVAAAVFLILWLRLTSQAFGWIGDGNLFGLFSNMTSPFDGKATDAADRPVVAAAVVLGVLFGVLGAIGGLFLGSGIVRRVGAAIALAVVAGAAGALLGALLGVPMSWGCALAVALAAFFVLFPILAAVFVLPNADWDEMKKRLTPTQTIETTKETIEWVREQMPLGRKS